MADQDYAALILAVPVADRRVPLALKAILIVYLPAFRRFGSRSRCFVFPGERPTDIRVRTFFPRTSRSDSRPARSACALSTTCLVLPSFTRFGTASVRLPTLRPLIAGAGAGVEGAGSAGVGSAGVGSAGAGLPPSSGGGGTERSSVTLSQLASERFAWVGCRV